MSLLTAGLWALKHCQRICLRIWKWIYFDHSPLYFSYAASPSSRHSHRSEVRMSTRKFEKAYYCSSKKFYLSRLFGSRLVFMYNYLLHGHDSEYGMELPTSWTCGTTCFMDMCVNIVCFDLYLKTRCTVSDGNGKLLWMCTKV